MDKEGLGATAVILLVVLFLTVVGVLPTLEHHADVQEHEPTEATVVSTDIIVTEDDDGDESYEPVVEYRYTVDGETYTSENVFPGSFSRSFGSRSTATDVTSQYASGDQVTIYYSPRNNGAAYLTNNGMPGTWWIGAIGAVVALAGGGWLVRTGFRRRKQRQLMADTPTETAQSLSMGPSELKGTALAADGGPMPAPFSNEECVLAKYEIEEYDDDHDDDGGSWQTVEEDVVFAPFYLDDDTGQVLVEPHEEATYDLDPEDWTETYVDSSTRGPAPIQDFVDSVGSIGYPHDGVGTDGDRKYRQNLIKDRESVYVFGSVLPREDASPDATDEERLVVRKVEESDPVAEPMFLISDDEEGDLVGRRQWALWRLPVGIGFVVGGVAMVVGMFGPTVGVTVPILV
jgi:hypothetical protein